MASFLFSPSFNDGHIHEWNTNPSPAPQHIKANWKGHLWRSVLMDTPTPRHGRSQVVSSTSSLQRWSIGHGAGCEDKPARPDYWLARARTNFLAQRNFRAPFTARQPGTAEHNWRAPVRVCRVRECAGLHRQVASSPRSNHPVTGIDIWQSDWSTLLPYTSSTPTWSPRTFSFGPRRAWRLPISADPLWPRLPRP